MKTIASRQAAANSSAAEAQTRAERRSKSRIGLSALYRKELADHLRSRRFLIILLLICVTSLAGLYGALSGLDEAMQNDSNFIFLKLYTTSGKSIPSFMSFIGLLGPLLGLALGFDAINSERNGGTLNRLVSQPIYRDSIIIGKFLAGTTVIALMVFAIGIGMGAIGVLLTGLVPGTEEVGRIFFFLLFTVVYIAFWLALAILFSVLCRHSATSALAVIALWIFFAIFMSLLSSILANAVYPIDTQYHAMVNSLSNYTMEKSINRISPYYLYSEAVSTIMSPTTRAINAVTMDQLYGAISGYLSLGQSLLLVWPHLVGLIALMLVTFAGSFLGFMRQEIRS